MDPRFPIHPLYCVGNYKQTPQNKDAFEKFKQKYKHGAVVNMGEITFVDQAKLEYNSDAKVDIIPRCWKSIQREKA